MSGMQRLCGILADLGEVAILAAGAGLMMSAACILL